ncbi:IS1 family transposase [Sorangium sp. So ce764]|uniref:IS1 family transposase n=1 Tax=unclassified Sorangium TaxID=2621164 RepID=UPI003F6010C9
MAHVLPMAKRVEVVAHLVEGAGIRPTSRLTEVSKPAILTLLLRVGEGCERLHNRLVRDVDCRTVQVDEIWLYVQKKEARVTPGDSPEVGEAYVFVGMASASKLVISYRVGKRDEANTAAFIADLRSRLVSVLQLYSDGWAPYVAAVGASFAGSVDYAQVVKRYNRKARKDDDHRYEPPRDPFITKTPVYGAPDMKRASTSHLERQNLTIRMHIRRFTRLCNGFSKRLPHDKAAVALHMAFYNFCRPHEAHRVTPAMEAGMTDRVWSVEELVTAALAEAPGEPPKPRALRLPEPSPGAPTAPARALPNGRGWLRVVDGGKGSATPAPAPEPSPVAPAVTSDGGQSPIHEVVDQGPGAQLDLFAWKPKPRRSVQLSLFSEDEP